MKTFYSLWSLVSIILLVAMSVSNCNIRVIILTATVCLIGYIGMLKEELKEELKWELKNNK